MCALTIRSALAAYKSSQNAFTVLVGENVEQRHDALLGGRRQISLEPRLLGRADAGRDVGVVAVQHDDVPRAQVVAVVALGGIAGLRPPVPEIPCRGRARVVVA